MVDEAERFEAILNASHGLVIQLSDVIGKPMKNRKAIAITKTPKPSGPPAPAAEPATPAQSVPPAVATPVTPPSADQPESTATEDHHIEWELRAEEVTTDTDGKLPEITIESQQAIMLLIPRIDYQAYNDAVSKEGMPEHGNKHVLQPHDGGEVAVAIAAPDNGWKPTPENTGGAAVPATAPESTPAPAPSHAAVPSLPPPPPPVRRRRRENLASTDPGRSADQRLRCRRPGGQRQGGGQTLAWS